MNKSILGAIFIGMFLHAQAATYVFEGVNYNMTNGPNYTEQMRLAGFIETAEELAPGNQYTTDIIIGYSFNDGVQTLNQSNSELAFGAFNTDSNGLPFFYRFTFTETPITNTIGQPFSEITLSFRFNTEGFERDEGGFTGPCLSSGTTVCSSADNTIDSGEFRSPGLGGAPLANWSLVGGAGGPQQVPVDSPWALLTMFFVLLFMLSKHMNHCKPQ